MSPNYKGSWKEVDKKAVAALQAKSMAGGEIAPTGCELKEGLWSMESEGWKDLDSQKNILQLNVTAPCPTNAYSCYYRSR